MPLPSSALPPAARKTTGDVLQAALVDLLILAMTTKQIHWNLYGSGFRPLHEHLDAIAATVHALADAIAERAATLAVAPDGRPITVAAAAHPALPAGRITVEHALAALAVHYDALVRRMRQRIAETADTDPITQDLLTSATAELEKQHWMLQAGHPA
ncbi:Dps family protein [Spirillospora sp. NPDC127200]